MAEIFTRKGQVQQQLEPCLLKYKKSGLEPAVTLIHQNILLQKIKFPLLEYCASEILNHFKEQDHIPFCDQIEQFKTFGGDVLIGKILQLKLTNHFDLAIDKAKEYISLTYSWHACDIIGELI